MVLLHGIIHQMKQFLWLHRPWLKNMWHKINAVCLWSKSLRLINILYTYQSQFNSKRSYNSITWQNRMKQKIYKKYTIHTCIHSLKHNNKSYEYFSKLLQFTKYCVWKCSPADCEKMPGSMSISHHTFWCFHCRCGQIASPAGMPLATALPGILKTSAQEMLVIPGGNLSLANYTHL